MSKKNIIYLAILVFSSIIFPQGITFTNYTQENSSLPSDLIYDILFDQGNKTWIATHSGLVKIEDSLWTIYDDQNSPLPPYSITSLEVSNDGLLWVGTSNGLFSFDGNSWCIFNTTNSDLPANHIRDLEIDVENNLWVSSWDVPNGGLSRLREGVWENFNTDNSELPHNYVSYIKSDLDSTVWVGVAGRLIHIDGENWTFYTSNNSGLTGSIINCIDFDSQGKIWIANEALPYPWPSAITEGALILHYDTTWTSYNYSDWSIVGNNNSVKSVGVGKNDIVWFGIGYQEPGYIYNNWGMGLIKKEDTSWTHYSSFSSQLVDNEITVIAFDENDRIWVGTRHGITVIEDSSITSIITQESTIIKSYNLYQNYPNPFNPTTSISYQIPKAGNVVIKIFDCLGKEIKELVNEYKNEGFYKINFNAANLSSGIYFCQLRTSNFIGTKKMILLR